jgi:hypothetical protein
MWATSCTGRRDGWAAKRVFTPSPLRETGSPGGICTFGFGAGLTFARMPGSPGRPLALSRWCRSGSCARTRLRRRSGSPASNEAVERPTDAEG